MLVSVVVPLYNHEAFVLDCLMSIFDQTWRDIELIVLDDVSRDRSFQLAQRFCQLDWVRSRFHRIHVDRNANNLGAAATINKAIALSTGDAIMVVNSDDRYALDRVAECVAALKPGSELVFSDVEYMDSEGYVFSAPQTEPLQHGIDKILSYPTISAAFLEMNRAISTGNLCFTRHLHDKIGSFRNLKYCHDWDFVLRAILETEPCFINKKLYFYRLHENNSFSALASVAEAETMSCYENFFHRLACGSIANPSLRGIFESETLWDGLVARAGAVAVEEWSRAKSGRPPRSTPAPQALESVGTSEPPAISDRGKGVFEMLMERSVAPIIVVKCGGELYPDGWIGSNARIRVRRPPDAQQLRLTFFIPEHHEPKLMTIRATALDEQIYRGATNIEPGRKTDVLLLKEPGQIAYVDIEMTVSGCECRPPDLRNMGVLFQRIQGS